MKMMNNKYQRRFPVKRHSIQYLVVPLVFACIYFFAGQANAGPVAGIFAADGTALTPFPQVAVGSSVALGDIDEDGVDEIVTGSPPGGRPIVAVYEPDGTLVRTILPYGSGLTTGVNVAVGRVTGSASADIIVVPRRGAGPHVLIYSADGQLLSPGFYAYSPRFHGGVNLSTGDVDGDGRPEIITGPGPGGGPHVSAFRANGTRIGNLFPYEDTFNGGTVVASLDYDGDGVDEVITAPETRRVADVKVFRFGSREQLAVIRAFGNFKGGVSVSADRLDSDHVLVAAGPGGGPQAARYNLRTGAIEGVNTFPISTSWRGGLTVAAVPSETGIPFFATTGSVALSSQQIADLGGVPGTETIGGANSSWEKRSVVTAGGTFSVNIVRVNLKNPNLRVVSLTGTSGDCRYNCVVRSLKSYVDQVGGFAGINGSYFCPADYASCGSRDGSFFWLWYNSLTRAFSNSYQNQFNQGPVIAFDALNRFFFYHIAGDWPGKATFEQTVGSTLSAAISNGPGLVFDGKLIVTEDQLDDKQRTVKSSRSGIGFKGDDVYLVVASGATVLDLGRVMEALGMGYAMNLDGGGSSALVYNGQYRVGPGRNIPNALVFVE